MTIKVWIGKSTQGKERAYASTPYHPAFPDKARNLGGIWVAEQKVWAFDVRDEDRVRELCRYIFGTDGREDPELVTVRVLLDPLPGYGDAWLFGRCLCARVSRDYRVRLGEGIIVVTGGFPSSGGSRNNPALNAEAGTVLEVRDVPKSLVERAMAKYPDAITLVEEDA